MEKFFYKLNRQCGYLNTHCLDHFIAEKSFSNIIHGFNIEKIEKTLWKKEIVLHEIDKNFPIKDVVIIYMEPNKCYKWHRDRYRLSTINLLLSANESSYTLLSENYDNDEDQSNISRLKYEPNCFYVFNTQEIHTVMNFSQPRYMISCQFNDAATSDYQSVKEYCKVIGI